MQPIFHLPSSKPVHPQIVISSSGRKTKHLCLGGMPAPIAKVKAFQDSKVGTFRTRCQAFPIKTIQRKQSFRIDAR